MNSDSTKPSVAKPGAGQSGTIQSTVLKRSVVINRHKTSISIEDVFWASLKEIARTRGITLSELIATVDAGRLTGANLSSAIRVFILDHYRKRLDELGRRSETPAHAPKGTGSSHLRR